MSGRILLIQLYFTDYIISLTFVIIAIVFIIPFISERSFFKYKIFYLYKPFLNCIHNIQLQADVD